MLVSSRRRAYTVLEAVAALSAVVLLMVLAGGVLLSAPNDAAPRATVEALTAQGDAALTQHEASGVWPSSISLPDVLTYSRGRYSSVYGMGENPVSLSVATSDGDRFCVDGDFDGARGSYYFSSVSAAPLSEGVHPGTCARGAAGADGAPVVDLASDASPASPRNWVPIYWAAGIVTAAVSVAALTVGFRSRRGTASPR